MRPTWVALFTLVAAAGVAACSTDAHGTASRAARPTWPAVRVTSLSPAPAQPPALVALTMLGPERGVGIFTRSVGARCQSVAADTSDGGAHFGNVSPITTFSCENDGGGSVSAIAADGAGDLFAYDSGLYVHLTGSGGWRARPQAGAVLALSAVGESVWMLLAECHGASITADGCTLRLDESADGGRTWRAAESQPSGAVAPGSSAGPAVGGGNAGQSWLVRTGPAAGYVFAAPAVNPYGTPDSAPIWFTGDGGISWSARRVGCGFDAQSDAASAAPGGVLAIVCAGQPGAGQQVKSTAISVDGGLTWTAHTQDQALAGYLGQIAAVSAQTIYLAGGRSSLLVTRDGGVHWRPVEPLIGDGSGGSGELVLFGPAHAWVVAAGGAASEEWDLFRTVDGGRTWSKMEPQLS